MDKRSVAPPITTHPNEECLPKHCASGLDVDCCLRKPRKQLVCPPPPPAWTCPKSSWRWKCDICGYCSCYLHKVEKCENSHFGPLLTTLSDDDNDDNDGDEDGWLVDVDIIYSDQPLPAIPADDGPIAAAAEGIVRLHSKPKVSQSCCGLVLLWLFSVFGRRMGQNWREIYVRATKSLSRLFFCHSNNVSLRSSFTSRHFFVLIPIAQKQLDPEAIWISAIFSLNFPTGVLAAYVDQFLHLLKTLPIDSHVQGLDNVTNISILLAMTPIVQKELLSGFLPS